MYYAKFTNNQLISTSTNYYTYIQISNDIALIYQQSRSSSRSDKYSIISKYVSKDNDIYIPLDTYQNMYYFLLQSSISIEPDYTNLTKCSIYDKDFSYTNDLYLLTYSSKFLFLQNLNEIKTSSLPSGTSFGTISNCYFMGTSYKYSDFPNWGGVGILKLSTLINWLVKYGNFIGSIKTPNNYNFYSSVFLGDLYGSGSADANLSFEVGWLSKSASNFNIYSYQFSTTSWTRTTRDRTLYPLDNLFKDSLKMEYGDYILLSASSNENGHGIFLQNDIKGITIYSSQQPNIYKTYPGAYAYSTSPNIFITNGDGTYLDINESSFIMFKSYINVGYYNTDTNTYSMGDLGYNASKIYQDNYTPTNKLKTLTFSNLEVLHNEDTGTYALTFTINNPNTVSVNTNLHISGRIDILDITCSVGNSEWSVIIDENKAGTIQATDISALDWENASDSIVYSYDAWTEPGYLREITIDSVYLSTIDNKTYKLNIILGNSNGVYMNAIIHYGKNLELQYSITIGYGQNIIQIPNVENVNGSIWIHYEQVTGYYPLPDSSTYPYTKLPVPPTPSSTGITLYKNNNNNKVVNKGYKLETYKVLNGTFRDSVNILNPVFQIENDEVPECNYCYIADFRRYYYIDTITCIRTGLYEIECSVDVLYTYKDSILNSEQYISRQENEYNELLQDSYVTFKDDYYYRIYFKPIEEFDYAIYDTDYNSKTNIVVETFGK